MAIERAIVIARMRAAFREGMSASRFLTQMRTEGLSYRRTDMLSDWRTQNNIARVKDALRFVRKDRLPSRTVIATVDWDLDKEFMYVFRCKIRVSPGAPVTERVINIQQDKALTPMEMIEKVEARWAEKKEAYPEELVEVIPFTAMRRAAL